MVLQNFGNLQVYTRQRLGIEQNEEIQDSELITLLNQSLGSLDEILCTDYEDYHITTYLATIGANSLTVSGSPNNTIPLPPDFFKLRGVDFGSPSQWITIFGFNLQQRNYFNNPYSNMYANYGNQVNRKVRVMDNQIVVEPLNLCSGQYQIWYTPKFMGLALPTDPIPFDMDTEGFIEYAVATTGQKVYSKLLLDTTFFEKQMAYYEDKVRNSAKNRMNLGGQCIVNVRNRGRGFAWGRGGFGV